MLIVLREQLTLQDINTTPKDPKQRGIVAIDSCLACRSSVWRNKQRSSASEKLPAHSDLSPDLELQHPRNHAIFARHQLDT